MEALPALTKITLCSESNVKTQVLKEVVQEFSWLNGIAQEFKDSQPTANPVQPINTGYTCSVRRIQSLGADHQTADHLVIAIENEIQAIEEEGKLKLRCRANQTDKDVGWYGQEEITSPLSF